MFPAGAFFRRAAVAAASLATVVAAHAAPAPRYSITEIAAPAMTWIEVTAVNNRGDVAGYFRSPQPGVSFEPEQGFLWSNGVLAPLGNSGTPAARSHMRSGRSPCHAAACRRPQPQQTRHRTWFPGTAPRDS